MDSRRYVTGLHVRNEYSKLTRSNDFFSSLLQGYTNSFSSEFTTG
jgi:hypothetical protein